MGKRGEQPKCKQSAGEFMTRGSSASSWLVAFDSSCPLCLVADLIGPGSSNQRSQPSCPHCKALRIISRLSAWVTSEARGRLTPLSLLHCPSSQRFCVGMEVGREGRTKLLAAGLSLLGRPLSRSQPAEMGEQKERDSEKAAGSSAAGLLTPCAGRHDHSTSHYRRTTTGRRART